ncbi:glycosyl transferase [Mucilaginibacter hurinus]|uniref:Glycosyl transferase n=1 Tax=Mucilaginibacter hurinus TaxID=2201324 RepID=A0A367GL45_9SPHI|nr:glycosyltransferase [Mucilaginibacter hurinus]RCH54179.1 glycosyl transferase [Mucilaginibacter hurinus]
MAIPKVIYQTFKHSRLPLLNRLAIKWLKWRNQNYRYEFYDDARIEVFLLEDFGADVLHTYKKINIGAAKADFFRYCILYKKGGIYLDIDAYVLGKLDEFIQHDDKAVISHERNPGLFVQWAMIYEAGHPFLRDTISNVMDNINQNKYPNDVHQMTGPRPYSLVINNYIANNKPVDYRILGVDYNKYIKSRLPLSKMLYKKGEHWKKLQVSQPVVSAD